MTKPKTGETWALKTNPAKTLVISYLNCLDIVGFHDAKHMKRPYGTLKLDTFLERYQPTT